MKVRMKLFGTLARRAERLGTKVESELDLPEGATVRDLLEHLGISQQQGAVVILDGIARSEKDSLYEGACAYVFDAVVGG